MSSASSTAGPPLFSFAVIADTHVNPDDGQSSSPWQTNRLANARVRAVVGDLNALEPEFVVHLGDMVHPVPSQSTYVAAAQRFHALVGNLQAPLHLVSGNHDVGDKPTRWTPAAAVNADFLAKYREHFGRDFYAFDCCGCRLIVINSQILNSGMVDEHDQWIWLEQQLTTEQRVFLFMHYPLFLHEADEDEHYDNVAEPSRSRLLSLLARSPVEALFCGHVHNLFYNRIGAVDCYVVPSLSAVRHDYSELFPVPPIANEHGRDARGKLGFFWIEVLARCHIAHWVRTWGEIQSGPAVARDRPRLHPRGPVHAPVGLDLRHGWLDPISIPHTGAVDEFGRKRVRNDYYLGALWEMGIRRLRIPLQDLTTPASSRRIAELAMLGHRFTVFMFGLPNAQQRRMLGRHATSLDAIEIIEDGSMLAEVAARIAALKSELGIPVYLSKLHRAGEHAEGRFAHVISHGFLPGEPAAAAVLEKAGSCGLDGIVYRLDRGGAPWPVLHRIGDVAQAADLRAIAHVRLAGNDPAQELTDDADTARLVADATLAAHCIGDRVSVFFDTFADHDRGYFPRHGLVDRSCDPRPAGLVLKRLVEMLSPMDRRLVAAAAGPVRIVQTSVRKIVILLPTPDENNAAIDVPSQSVMPAGDYAGVRLDTGACIAATVRAGRNGLSVKFADPCGGMPLAISMIDESAVVRAPRTSTYDHAGGPT